MFFEVIFLYRELIDAITPWIAQQSGGSVQLGIGATLALASFGWLGVRGMSWFLFGRFGTPALLAILSRQAVTARRCTRPVERAVEPGLWREPVNALKAETAWFHEEAKRMFELLSLPGAPAPRGRDQLRGCHDQIASDVLAAVQVARGHPRRDAAGASAPGRWRPRRDEAHAARAKAEGSVMSTSRKSHRIRARLPRCH